MKQYKLIKWYPSLPKNWEKGMIVGLGDRCIPSSFSPCSGKYEDYYILYEEVVNNPEFWEEIVKLPVGTKVLDTFSNENKYTYVKQKNGKWALGTQDYFNIDEKSIGENKRFKLIEEVVEKDYEILSFKQDSKMVDLWTYFENKGWCRNNNGKPETSPYKSLDSILNNHLNGGIKYDIYSVKRLSDGEVFTIGDKVTYGKNTHGEIRTISEITLSKANRIFFSYKEDNLTKYDDWLSSNFQHYKKPLFTTEDGVDIFEGALCFAVKDDFTSYQVNTSRDLHYKHKLTFSTKEAAEDYILINKPCLPIKEIAPIIGQCNDGKYINLDILTEKLKLLVKSKL